MRERIANEVDLKQRKHSEPTGLINPAANVFPDHIALGKKKTSVLSTMVLILATPFVLLAVFGVWLKELLAKAMR
jgi:hypothetical protein